MIPNTYPTLNFDLGETADMIRETVASFAQNEIAPRAAEIDRTDTFPRDLALDQLELADGLAELFPVMDVGDHDIHAGLHDAGRAG